MPASGAASRCSRGSIAGCGAARAGRSPHLQLRLRHGLIPPGARARREDFPRCGQLAHRQFLGGDGGGASPLAVAASALCAALVAPLAESIALTDFVLSPSRWVTESFLARGFPAERILPTVYVVDLTQFTPAPEPRPPRPPADGHLHRPAFAAQRDAVFARSLPPHPARRARPPACCSRRISRTTRSRSSNAPATCRSTGRRGCRIRNWPSVCGARMSSCCRRSKKARRAR